MIRKGRRRQTKTVDVHITPEGNVVYPEITSWAIDVQVTLGQHAAMLRRMAVGNCLGWWRLIRKFDDVDTFREHLREAQKRLVKVRAYRATGIYPGGDS